MDNVVRELLVTATLKTRDGRLRWKAFDSESFRVPIGSGYLHVHRLAASHENDAGETRPATTYSARVSDEQGRTVAKADVTQGFGGGDDFVILTELFEAARKSALKTDKVVEDMLEALRAS